MKKLNLLFTALLLLCSVGTATAHDFEVGGIYYNISSSTNKTVEVTYKGTSYNDYSNEYTGSVVIPESVTYNGSTYSVTSIGSSAFRDCSKLTSITIPNSVTSIGDYAFYYCYGLTSITIPNSVTSIGVHAFVRCSGLKSITIPNSVTSIGDWAFGHCSGLTSITIPNSVTSIGVHAFYNCYGLTSITIPNSVTSIGDYAFMYCEGLTSITIPNSVTSIEGWAFAYCKGLTSIEIPNSVTSIENGAFEYCSGLTGDLIIPNSVTSIGNYAFSGCSGLTNITVAAGNAKYDSRDNCNAIIETETNTLIAGCKNTIIPNSVTSIEEGAFVGCTGLTSITIPNSVTSIGGSAFQSCTGLTSITIPNSVTSIGVAAFRWCDGLTSITIPNSVTSIGGLAFQSCTGLTSITIPNSVTSIGVRVFEYCSGLTNVTIPNSVTSIGGSAFYDCSGLTSITIPNSVISIGGSAFEGCTGLTSITIPNSVTSIGDDAFYRCTGLKTIYNFSNLTFSIGSATKVYNAPNGSIEGDFIFGKPNDVNSLLYYLGNATKLTLPADYKGENYVIGADAFNGNTTITSITIPNSVTSIGNGAFGSCTGLTNITVAAGNAKYDSRDNCNAIIETETNTLIAGCKNTIIPNSVTSIGGRAFEDCTGLTSITIPNSVTSIGDDAFYRCTGLKTIYNFSNLTFSIGSATKVYNAPNGSIEGDFIFGKPNDVNSLLYYLGNATKLTLPADYKGENYVIGADAFNGNTTITSITIPNSVTSIGNGAFGSCTGLTNITVAAGNAKYDSRDNCNAIIETETNTLIAGCKNTIIPNSVTSIGGSAFEGCTGLTSITIPNSVTSIGDDAFYRCTGLKTIYNFSNLTFSIGSATKVYNAPNGSIEGDFIFGKPNDVNSLLYYLGNATKLTLPADYKGENYVIGADAFNGNTTITSITIPNSVTSIGNNAFNGCTGLKTIYNFSNLTFSIGSATKVYNAPNGSIEGDFIFGKPNDVNSLLYYLGNATKLTLPADYKGENYVIGADAFNGNTTITSITIPNSVTSIGNGAFGSCTGLTNITVAAGNAKYDSRDNCNAIIETETNTLIAGCKNTIIPNSVTSIGGRAFEDCTGLTSITIPNSVTSIGDDAFYRCTGLKTIYNFSNLTFSIGSATKVYNAPNGSIEGDFIFGKPNDVNSLLYYLGNATKLTLPADYKGENYVIGADAFNGNTTITSITIPNSVTSIGNAAFEGCTGLEKIDLNTTRVGAWFNGINSIKEVVLGSNVTSVGSSAFSGCTGLASITIPNSVTSIGELAFEGCIGLTAVYISDLAAWCGIDFGSADANPLYYAKNLYLNDELLTELSIPAEATEVKDYAFYNCRGITNIDIVDGVKNIGNSAFYGCNDLESFYISNTIESIGDYAFAECNNIFEVKIGSKKVITASENIFSNDAYNNAYLYVPTGRRDFYAKTSPWSNFIISEMDFTGIDDITEQRVEGENVYYDLSGRAVENPTNGIYIINGKKVLVK